ncbi:ABC transporter permease [Kitasatospora sp. NBC_00315]|uniref:ABC transporter permease n=1 Tax=Kitasatospora sp. NBC_00315 TaxID=2975963 RepID=UPI0032489ABB
MNTPAPPPADVLATERPPVARRLLARPEIGALFAAVAVFLFFAVAADSFLRVASVGTVLYAASTIGIMAVPVSLLMIGGEFDLSAGVLVTTAALTSSMVSYQFTAVTWVGTAVSLVVVLAVSGFNGWVLGRTGLPSFIVTLGTFLMLTGANLGVTKLVTGTVTTRPISDMQGFASCRWLFASEVTVGGLTVKATVWWWLALLLTGSWVLLRTGFGNWIFAVGGDAAAARAVGVPVGRTRTLLYLGVGFCAWVLGQHLLYSFDTVQSGEGVGNELIYIVAAVIGGCLITGGYGSVAGSALGALIFGMTSKGIVYAQWNPDWFKFFLGAMLLLAALLNAWVRRRVERGVR